jgi:hypothetical protein
MRRIGTRASTTTFGIAPLGATTGGSLSRPRRAPTNTKQGSSKNGDSSNTVG